jgi:2-methylisocitrate lyase-like PEP mutase family enzyme
LRELVKRPDKVLTVMHPGSAHMAKVMEMAGAEAAFVGTSVVIGAYTGMEDLGVASIPESVLIGGWIARAVTFPVILDGDTGHGGVMAVRRLVEDSIRAGLAGLRIDDQAIEKKRGTGTKSIELAPLDVAVARYRAAVDAAQQLDPDFMILANCYAGEAQDSNFQEVLRRIRAYKEVAGVDWVVVTSVRSVGEMERVRATVDGPVCCFGTSGLDDQKLLDLGFNIRWGAATLNVPYAALFDYVSDYMRRGPVATEDWRQQNLQNPFSRGSGFREGGREEKLRDELEAKYFAPDVLRRLQEFEP